MESKLVEEIEISAPVNFGKIQLLKLSNERVIVLTNGVHSGHHFSGTIVYSECLSLPMGSQDRCFLKGHFELLPESDHITLRNN